MFEDQKENVVLRSPSGDVDINSLVWQFFLCRLKECGWIVELVIICHTILISYHILHIISFERTHYIARIWKLFALRLVLNQKWISSESLSIGLDYQLKQILLGYVRATECFILWLNETFFFFFIYIGLPEFFIKLALYVLLAEIILIFIQSSTINSI